MDTSTIAIGGAIVVVLIVAVVAIIYLVGKQAECPSSPSFWSTPDRAAVDTVVECPAGSAISVAAADFGAPWSRCPWVDVTAAAQNLMNGKNSYQVPAGTSLGPALGVATPCKGGATFAGAYTCRPVA
ncbi:MAG: hypothetical protein WC700_07725 [Gemmatimonadaceae bacterium]|jgi:hypothetical protein